jgi:hypothetical protein
MAEDLDDYRRIFDAGDDLQGAAAVGAVFHVDIEDPFEQSGPADARRRALTVSVLAWGLGGRRCRSGNRYGVTHEKFVKVSWYMHLLYSGWGWSFPTDTPLLVTRA